MIRTVTKIPLSRRWFLS